jgi:hypothetical protein
MKAIHLKIYQKTIYLISRVFCYPQQNNQLTSHQQPTTPYISLTHKGVPHLMAPFNQWGGQHSILNVDNMGVSHPMVNANYINGPILWSMPTIGV